MTSKMFSPKPLTEPWLENCSLMAAVRALRHDEDRRVLAPRELLGGDL